jgi:hypothetical protein
MKKILAEHLELKSHQLGTFPPIRLSRILDNTIVAVQP